YMTDVVGVAGSVIGTIILICRFADGASDLFMGSVIDNTNTKMGKAKPWVFWTAPILGVLTFLLFIILTFYVISGKLCIFLLFIFCFLSFFILLIMLLIHHSFHLCQKMKKIAYL